ncbi:LGFP repeat-containing protein [Rhodococcoides fascians]|uniref:LGFP repeat-containing protein n=1 Tax=Rhodococcoides fascians TaxID=1828 RepID=UPI00211AFCFC|nr:hypothetical protein [Rhodococcus sp. 06-1059B-a]
MPIAPLVITSKRCPIRRWKRNGDLLEWSPATGAHPVVNSFLNRWGVHQYESGWLKYPTTDEIVLPDGGRRQEFQAGAICVAFQNAIGSATPWAGPLDCTVLMTAWRRCGHRAQPGCIGTGNPHRQSALLFLLAVDHRRCAP